jgi:glucose 1-dehydrogenase
MQAVAIKPGAKNNAYLTEISKPDAEPDKLLIRVLETGICGTDLEIVEGLYGDAPGDSDFLVLGHENFGVVENGTGDWQKGDYVVCTVRRPCHHADPNCQQGRSDMCLTGDYTERGIKGLHGYMREFYTESPDYAVKVPAELRHIGVLLEPTAVVEKAIFQAYKIQERLEWQPRRAVVFGAGPIGLLATFILRDKGLEVYTVAHSLPGADNQKAQLVGECGAEYISSQQTAPDALKGKLGQIDLMLDATGNSETAFKALYSLGVNGVMALTSVSGGHNSVALDTNVLNINMVLNNQVMFGSVNANRRYFEMGVNDWQNIERKFPGLLQKLITRRLPIADYKTALTKDRSGIKTVLEIT